MLKMAVVELEMISDVGIYQFIEKGTRGGVSYLAQIYSKANNEAIKFYDKNKPCNHIIFKGANNLHGWATWECLHMESLELINAERFHLNEFIDDSPKKSVLEVDREYPKELQDLHIDYPLAPDKSEFKNNV